METARGGARIYNAVPRDGKHEVLRGDTVYAISRRYGVPVRALIVANDLKAPYTLRVGDSVKVPTPRIHQVARGETLYAISRRYEVSVNELVRLNGLTPPYGINADETLLLPEAVDSQLAAVSPPPPKSGTDAESSPDAAHADIPDTASPTDSKPKKAVTAAIPQPPERSSGRFLWPLKGEVISGFGPKGKGLHNDGINIASPRGTPVLAAENGVVAYAGNELQGFGNLVLLQHADGYMTAYAHADALLVERGATVQRGQIIARVGSSGSVDTPQLHFEIRRGRRPVDPARYLGTQTASR
ncbi:MAG: peptidoglycan DD-metalloendopeptidase family protein [Alphaproteobacteria bacterium]